jgi:rubrerythrin
MTTDSLSEYLTINRTMGFQLEDLSGKSGKLLDSLLKKKFNLQEKKNDKHLYWDAEAYGLQATTLFKSSNESDKLAILKTLNDLRFMEALSIEKAGIHYHSKMVLLSDKLDEKSFYAAFVADEMKHFHSFLQFTEVETPAAYIDSNPFLQLINFAIKEGDRDCMIVFLQNILEGLGMSYYRDLKDTTNDDSLRGELDTLLKDEAFHVGSAGLFLEGKTYDPSKPLLRELVFKFAEGHPGWITPVLFACETIKGGLTNSQKVTLLEELNYESINARKTIELRRLILSPFTSSLVDELDNKGLFNPITANQLVGV